jgi:hypothetical protein
MRMRVTRRMPTIRVALSGGFKYSCASLGA